MRKILFCTTALFISTAGYSQRLKGYVYDKESHVPLPGVNISYQKSDGKKVMATSRSDGSYEIRLIPGEIDVAFSYLGYQKEQIRLSLSAHEEKNKDIYLHTQSTLLDNVVISAGRYEQKLSEVTVSMDVVKSNQITQQAPTDLSATLNTLPSIDINDKQPSIRGGGGWTYGVGARSLVLVDGMSALSSGNGVINWNVLPLENIAQVEVMKGASSVLYGSSALNGVINIRSKRPGIDPQTTARAYLGIYGNPPQASYQWSNKNFWKEGKYEVEPFLRKSLLTGIRNPIYEGIDFSHSRRIGNFDISAGINLFTDEGYRQQNYNKRFRMGGNLTYHHPLKNEKILRYGFNFNFLSDQYGDFFIWRSPVDVYRPSALTNMGREGNTFNIDPNLKFINTEKQTTHTLKSRFYYRGDNIMQSNSHPKPLSSILTDMGADMDKVKGFAQQIQNKNFNSLIPVLLPVLIGDYELAANNATDLFNGMFPHATTADYSDLISWLMKHGLPQGENGMLPWISDVLHPVEAPVHVDKNYTFYLDYQFNKKWDNGVQITTGATYEHMKSSSATTGEHKSDNAAAFFQYDQRLFDRLSLSAGMRLEYFRVDDYLREADTKFFGTHIPVRPIFRAGMNYQLGDYSFLRASFGQGYRYPSLTEKYALKDIGGVGVYPNPEVKAEKGINAEVGFKQGYQFGKLKGFVDLAAFYTRYDDMIEFRFGFFNNTHYQPINSMSDVIGMLLKKEMPGIGAQFYNVSKARIYGAEINTTGNLAFNKETSLSYNLGYIFIEPEYVDYKDINAREEAYEDPLQMKEKSNNSKYLKYRQKHTAKAVLDFNWKRWSIGTNIIFKSKTLAVDYLMVDERPKAKPDLMDYARQILFGDMDGVTLQSYWEEHNKAYCTVDLRTSMKMTKATSLQFSVNNLFNKEYSSRPMAVAAPRTFIVQFYLNL